MEGDLENIKKQIESMPKFHQVEVLRILSADSDVVLNENKNGVFINLSQVCSDTLSKLNEYVQYFHAQQESLQAQESTKASLSNLYFNPHKDNNTSNVKITKRVIERENVV